MSRHVRRFEHLFARLNLPARLASVPAIDLAIGSGWQRSKLASGAIATLALALMVFIHVQDIWFVYHEDVAFSPLRYLDRESLYQTAGVEGWNVFWLEPEEVRARLLAQPFVADALVRLALPGRVEIEVLERSPVAVWVTGQGDFWLTQGGAALPVRAGGPSPGHLPHIVDSLMDARSVEGSGDAHAPAMDPTVLESALALVQTMPELRDQVRYNRGIGLNFPMPGNTGWVYWGDGTEIETKLTNLAAARKVMAEDEPSAQIIDVRFANRPYVR
jgi:cell division protein FtsQ